MTLLEAIQLVQTRPPGEFSAEELAQLRDVVQQQPALAAAVGGQARLAEYLAEAESAVAARPAQGEPPPPVSAPQELPAPRTPKVRRTVELSIYSLLIAAAVGLLYWQLAPFIHRADPAQQELAAVTSEGVPAVVQPSEPSRTSTTEKQPGAVADVKQPEKPLEDSKAAAAPDDPPQINEWRGWQITRAVGCRTDFQSVWDLADPSKPEPVKLLITQAGVARLECELEIPADAKMLALDCRQMVGTPDDPQAAAAPHKPGTLTLKVDGQQTAVSPVPAPDYPGSLMLALGGAQGRRAKLVIQYTSADPQERVIWRNFGFSRAPSEVLLASGEPEPRNKHLRLWLRADSGIRDAAGRGPTEPGFDGTVQSWEDRSTGGRHLTSDTGDASRRPAFVPSQAQIGNRPAVAFDAANDFLQYSVGGVFNGGPSTTLAVFHLSHYHSTKDRRRYCVVFDTTPSGVSLKIHNGSGIKNGHTIAFGPLSVTSTGQLHGQFVITTAQCNAAASFLDINGGLRNPVAMENVKSETNFVLGLPVGVPPAFGGYPTQIAEIMVFDRALTDLECRQLGQYLTKRYGIIATY